MGGKTNFVFFYPHGNRYEARRPNLQKTMCQESWNVNSLDFGTRKLVPLSDDPSMLLLLSMTDKEQFNELKKLIPSDIEKNVRKLKIMFLKYVSINSTTISQKDMEEIITQFNSEDFDPCKYDTEKNDAVERIPQYLLTIDEKTALQWTLKFLDLFTRKFTIYHKFAKYKQYFKQNYIQILLNSAAKRKSISENPHSCLVVPSIEDLQRIEMLIDNPTISLKLFQNAKLYTRYCILYSRAVKSVEPLQKFLEKFYHLRDPKLLYKRIFLTQSRHLILLVEILYEYSILIENEEEKIEIFSFAESLSKQIIKIQKNVTRNSIPQQVIFQIAASYRYSITFSNTTFGMHQFEYSISLFLKFRHQLSESCSDLPNIEEITEQLNIIAMLQYQVWMRQIRCSSFELTSEIKEQFKNLHQAFAEVITAIEGYVHRDITIRAEPEELKEEKLEIQTVEENTENVKEKIIEMSESEEEKLEDILSEEFDEDFWKNMESCVGEIDVASLIESYWHTGVSKSD